MIFRVGERDTRKVPLIMETLLLGSTNKVFTVTCAVFGIRQLSTRRVSTPNTKVIKERTGRFKEEQQNMSSKTKYVDVPFFSIL